MGYYVHTAEVNFRIKKANLDKAYQAVCEINKHNDLKGGGSSTGEKWFSWMMADYPAHCKDIFEVLHQLGFEVVVSEDPENKGDIMWLSYDSKTGDEKVFFTALAPFIEDGSFINWVGEDHDLWQWMFKDGKMLHIPGVITYDINSAQEPCHHRYWSSGDKLMHEAIPLNKYFEDEVRV